MTRHKCAPVMQVLAQLPNLQNLTLKGCPLTEQPGYPEIVKELLPRLQILDSHRLSLPGRAGKQPGKAAVGAADASLPGKGSKMPPASSDAAVDMGRSAGVKGGVKPKVAQSIKPHDSSNREMASSSMSTQAVKRKRDDSSASAAPERTALGQQQPSREPSKKQMKTGSVASAGAVAVPIAQPDPQSKFTLRTSKAKADSKQAAEASLPAGTASVQKPNTKPGSIKDEQRLDSIPGQNVQQSSGAELSGTVVADMKVQPRPHSKSSKQQKAAAIAPKQKGAKQGSLKAMQPANGSNALATGKEVMSSELTHVVVL